MAPYRNPFISFLAICTLFLHYKHASVPIRMRGYLQRNAHVVIIRAMREETERCRQVLKDAAEQAKLLGFIEDATVHNVMNLLITLGLAYLRDEGRKGRGYR